MRFPQTSVLLGWFYIAGLMTMFAVSFLYALPNPQDDHFLYQRFIESLAQGRLDLSIPGFHGSDLFGFVAYLFTGSPLAQIHGLIFLSILLPLIAYLAGKALYGSEWHGIVLATIIALMPFISFVCLRGWTGPGYWFLMLLTIFLAAHRSRWAGISWGLAVLTKPFAVVLAPLLLIFAPTTKTPWKRYGPILMGVSIVLLYLFVQYMQAGRIIVGAHAEIDHTTLWQGPGRFLVNLAHSLQILFSVHNYYFPAPGLTGPGNMLHTTPVLIFLGLFGLLSSSPFYKSRALRTALLVGAITGIAMNALLDHMDHFYMEASVLLLILAALPVLRSHLLWIPLVLATLHFQWLYFYLDNGAVFSLSLSFFLTPLFVDICFALWILLQPRETMRLVKESFSAS
jgi:Gpi18-like mannosyltransferase